jgi:periplasmic protein TonB
MRLPLTLSISGHAILLGLLILLATKTQPLPEPTTKGGTQIFLGSSVSQPQTVLTPEAANQQAAPSAIATLSPQEIAEPEPAVAAIEPPPTPAPETPASPPLQSEPVPPSETAQIAPAPPPPPRKPVTRQLAKPVMRPPARAPVSEPATLPTQLAQAPPAAVGESRTPTVQQAAAAPVPAPDFAAEYRAMISAWFEAHKHYPDSARQRGEEGSVRLSFRVDRFGRVLDHTLLTGTGFADLDVGVDQMMRGAQLPPFPAGMTMPQIEVAVTIRFSLTR